jgi:cysteine desulfurase/selenocysteine lyase
MTPDTCRIDFPIFTQQPGNQPFVYLDSAATSLKPQPVIQAVEEYYQSYSANIHRGIYGLSERATLAFESARSTVAQFIGTASQQEIVFTKGTTEGINLLATSLSRTDNLQGFSVVVTSLEHHANFVPWQQLAKQEDMHFSVVAAPLDGVLTPALIAESVKPETKVVAFTAVSNVLGTIQPVSDIVAAVKAKSSDCLVVVDAAQAIPHLAIDVEKWGADAIVFSGHKLFGPTGVGVLWARLNLLERLSPYQYGGGMIRSVTESATSFAELPDKFEAGTPPIAEAIGLQTAIKYLSQLGYPAIRAHEQQLLEYALLEFAKRPWIRVYGTLDPTLRTAVIAFTVEGVHAHDVAQILADQGICVRAGHHCAMPLHTQLGISASVRLSFSVYNSQTDIDQLCEALEKVRKVFQ